MTTARDTYNQIVYAEEKGREEGRKEGREEGLKEGEEKGKLEIARKMLEMGMDVNTIATATNLTPLEIEELKEAQMPE